MCTTTRDDKSKFQEKKAVRKEKKIAYYENQF